MSAENVGVVRRVHEAINARDEAALEELLDPGVVWVQNPNAPDPSTADTVVAVGGMRARDRGSGVEIREPRAWVWLLRDGKIIRHETFTDIAAALEGARPSQ